MGEEERSTRGRKRNVKVNRMLATTQALSFLVLSLILFTRGLGGVLLHRRNIIVLLMSIELMLLAVNFQLIVHSALLDDLLGQVFARFVLTVAASESSVGLAILVAYYRLRGSVSRDEQDSLMGG